MFSCSQILEAARAEKWENTNKTFAGVNYVDVTSGWLQHLASHIRQI